MKSKTKYEAVEKYRRDKKVVQVFLPPKLHMEFKIACVNKGKLMKDVLLNAICKFIKE